MKLLKEKYRRLIITAKVLFFMCYKTKLKLMGLSRDCIFKTTCALSTYQTTLMKCFFLVKFDVTFEGKTHAKVHNYSSASFPC